MSPMHPPVKSVFSKKNVSSPAVFFAPTLPLKVVGNEKVGGSGMCQTVPIWLGPRRSMFFSLSILLSS